MFEEQRGRNWKNSLRVGKSFTQVYDAWHHGVLRWFAQEPEWKNRQNTVEENVQ